MAKQQTEDELNIKRRARRRLIGAIALALAVVVILPMVLDSEPRPGGQDIELRIPDPDKAGEFVPGIAPVTEPSSGAVEVSSQAESAVLAEPSASTEVPVAVSKPFAPAKLTEANPPQQAQAETPGPLEAKAEVKAEVKANDSYVVQVGAFSNAATAAHEADKLKGWGFKAYTELIGGTTRVRVGPYGNRDKADAVRLSLEKHGLHPVVKAVK